ncbi:hypothetical protein [Providencia stuartii]|uniref:hypothetical protein n=1 Tax=Providencia stuartii TaxID=588 RepID=UPI001BCE02B2|nr:hypothetical protein [Providencia thailandensis]MBS7782426.1 hypothetical protein [Providencia thailandensis]
MAMKLEIIINHDEDSNKSSIEWSTASTDNVTKQERQMLSQVQKALLLQLNAPTSSTVLH